MKNKGAKPKPKRKGAAGAFGCDLTEHLESSGQDGNRLFRPWGGPGPGPRHVGSRARAAAANGRKARCCLTSSCRVGRAGPGRLGVSGEKGLILLSKGSRLASQGHA